MDLTLWTVLAVIVSVLPQNTRRYKSNNVGDSQLNEQTAFPECLHFLMEYLLAICNLPACMHFEGEFCFVSLVVHTLVELSDFLICIILAVSMSSIFL